MKRKKDSRRSGRLDWRKTLVKILLVTGMAGVGVAMMAGGLLAWVEGEEVLFLAGVVTGAIFVSAGGIGMLRCLDQVAERPGF